MRHDVEHAVEVLARLLLHGLDDFWMAVTDIEHTDAADPVEEAVAVEVLDDGAFGALHDDGVAAVDGTRHRLLTAGDDGGGFRSRQGRSDDFWQSIS